MGRGRGGAQRGRGGRPARAVARRDTAVRDHSDENELAGEPLGEMVATGNARSASSEPSRQATSHRTRWPTRRAAGPTRSTGTGGVVYDRRAHAAQHQSTRSGSALRGHAHQRRVVVLNPVHYGARRAVGDEQPSVRRGVPRPRCPPAPGLRGRPRPVPRVDGCRDNAGLRLGMSSSGWIDHRSFIPIAAAYRATVDKRVSAPDSKRVICP